jgi:hypothetical protein
MRRPLGVTLILIGQWLFVATGVVMGVAVLFGWRGLERPLDAGSDRVDLFAELGKWSALLLFVVSAVLAVLALSFARLQNWARVLFVVVLLANAVGDVVALVFYALYYGDSLIAASALVKLPLSIGIAWYLSRPRVREAFVGGTAT